MVKTVTDTDTAIEEKKFLEKAVKILTSLGYSTSGHTQEWLESMMNKEGFSKGYNGTWFMSDDVNSETDLIA